MLQSVNTVIKASLSKAALQAFPKFSYVVNILDANTAILNQKEDKGKEKKKDPAHFLN